jgi:hypothetical protein
VKILKHFQQQPFIVATGFAALIHSTWSLGTFFSGEQPSEPLHLALWLIPALLIAFSLDVGQIVTSSEIRAGQRSRSKYFTFSVFAAATYFLQFVYCASHMPQIPLAAGVRETWGPLVSFIRDSAVFVVPALLPLSTLLYTFSQEHSNPTVEPAVSSTALVALQADPGQQIIIEKALESKVEVECNQCDWAGAYDSQRAAQNALTAHRRKHGVLSPNGNGAQEMIGK